LIPLLPDEKTLRRLHRLRLQRHIGPASSPPGSRHLGRPGSSREYQGLRPYESGDDVRDLDWAASSRFQRPYVRVYQQEIAPSLLLLIDSSSSMGFGEPSKLAYAQALATALGYVALVHYDEVGAATFTDQVKARLATGRGRGQWSALRRLVTAITHEGRTGFSEVARALSSSRPLRGIAVILSDFYPAGAFATGLRRLAQSALSVVAVQIVSPQELDPPLDGELELVDLESGETRRGWIGDAERATYHAALTAHGSEVARICRESGVRCARVSTAVPVSRCLQEALVHAGVLRRGTS
jgi:uncharacterized protein (DUF58 family)